MQAKAMKEISQKRSLFSNKYSNGRILVIGGSSSYYGAPVLSINSACQSLAALRVGAGYVKAFVPLSILKTARSLSPNTVIQQLGKDTIQFNAAIKAEIGKADVVLIGMGTGSRSQAASGKIIAYALQRGKNVIVDADAIPAVKRLKVKGKLLITPHDGEFKRLTGINVSQKNLKQRAATAANAAKQYNCIVVLKGHDTITTDGKRTKVNKAKSAALATMGSGDVLSGIIAGYAATGNDLFKSAAAGVYVHLKIGDMLYKTKGNHIIATDIIESIPRLLKKFDS